MLGKSHQNWKVFQLIHRSSASAKSLPRLPQSPSYCGPCRYCKYACKSNFEWQKLLTIAEQSRGQGRLQIGKPTRQPENNQEIHSLRAEHGCCRSRAVTILMMEKRHARNLTDRKEKLV